jgi:hypothetical protein
MTTPSAAGRGLAAFLKQSLWDRTTGDKYVYDIEVVHYGLLALLLEKSADFAERLLGSSSKVERVVEALRSDLFDLEVRTADALHFIEVKTWHSLKPEQIDGQVAILTARAAHGIYLLTPFQLGDWTPSEIRRRSGGRARLVEFSDLAGMLRDTMNSLTEPLKEVASSYADAIDLLQARTRAAA